MLCLGTLKVRSGNANKGTTTVRNSLFNFFFSHTGDSIRFRVHACLPTPMIVMKVNSGYFSYSHPPKKRKESHALAAAARPVQKVQARKGN